MRKIINSIKADKKKALLLLFAVVLVVVGLIAVSGGSSEEETVNSETKHHEAIPLPGLEDTLDPFATKSDIYLADQSQAYQDSMERMKFQDQGVDFFGANEKKNQQTTSTTNKKNGDFDEIFGGNSCSTYTGAEENKKDQNKSSDEEHVIVVDQSQIKRTRIPSDGYGNMGSTATTKDGSNTLIKAVVSNNNKPVKTGSTIRIRITEDCKVGNHKIAANTIISGICSFTRERVKIAVNSINIAGNIIACSYTVYEIDGIEGVYVPGGINTEIVKDGADEAITEGGTKINTPIGSFSTDALIKKNQDPSVLIRDGHKVYLKLLDQ